MAEEPEGRRERGLGLERKVDARDVWGPKSSLEGMVGSGGEGGASSRKPFLQALVGHAVGEGRLL